MTMALCRFTIAAPHVEDACAKRPILRSDQGRAAIVTLGFARGGIVYRNQLGGPPLVHSAGARLRRRQAQTGSVHWETNDKAWVVTTGPGAFYR